VKLVEQLPRLVKGVEAWVGPAAEEKQRTLFPNGAKTILKRFKDEFG
jgi:hypothetical protein